MNSMTLHRTLTLVATKIYDFVVLTGHNHAYFRRRFFFLAHYDDFQIESQTFERKSYAIACRRLKGAHSYDRVAQLIKEIHASYGIDKKVLATVTDNGSNFVKAFREFGVNVGESFFQAVPESSNNQMDGDSDENDHAEIEEFIPNDEFDSTDSLPEQIHCASHTLNLVATTDMLNYIKSCKILHSSYNQMIQRCNLLWKLLSSPKNSEKLKKVLGQSLQKSVVTRSNSLYQSIFQIFGLKDKILSSGEESGIDNLLDEDNFRFIEEYLHCNQSIADAIDKLQGDKLASYGYLLPTLVTFRNKLNRCKQLRFQYCH
ncbi:uncharacterized protein LOC130674623 [Microplitis mediator]|uniref:uncharacterized protein LOC130674623 n=1 Tax=Microplitis mediator TaxID=375433 RepID=UPI0025526FE5|nr:uncharacterized protein LOC130674623 [Microplitis mediator]